MWFAKEIKNITIRNLTDESRAHKRLPSPRLEIYILDDVDLLTRKKVLITRSVPDSCNATWVIAGSWTENLLENVKPSDIYVRLYDAVAPSTSESENSLETSGELSTGACLFEQKIELSKLVLIGPVQLSNLSSLPANSLFFGCESGYFVMEASGLLPLIKAYPEKNFGMDSADHDRHDQHALEEYVQNTLLELESLKLQVGESTSMLDKRRLESELKLIKSDMQNLKLEVLLLESYLAEDEEKENEELQALCDLHDLKSLMGQSQELSNEINELTENIKLGRTNLIKGQFMLEARQLKLLTELYSVYPIEQLDNGDYSIRGLELPSDLNFKDDEMHSSALGLVVHLLLLTSKYLEVPLRYQLLFYASRSMIRDPVHGLTLPLFRRGTERERFERAIVWLKRDVEQLLSTRGVVYDQSKDILYNINLLYINELGTSLGM